MATVLILLDKLALPEPGIATTSITSLPFSAYPAITFSAFVRFSSNGLATTTISANLAGAVVELAAALSLELPETGVDLGKLTKVDAKLIITSGVSTELFFDPSQGVGLEMHG
jgi:hypothetical protein